MKLVRTKKKEKSLIFRALVVILLLPGIAAIIPVSSYSEDYTYDWQKPAPTEVPSYGGTAVFAYGYDWGSFNGILDYWRAMSRENTLEPFLLQQAPGDIVGLLAESFETSADGKTWTFHLRDNIKWSDGFPFTTADILWHYEQVMNEVTPQTAQFTAFELQDITAPDPKTVVFKFGKTVPSSEPWFSLWGTSLILPKHIYEGQDLREHPANMIPVGTGPYKVVDYVPGQYVVMDRNEFYWGPEPYLDRIIVKIIMTAEGRLAALLAGEVDICDSAVPLSAIPSLLDDPEFDVVQRVPGSSWRITFNFKQESVERHPWVDDVNVRFAMAYAINRQEIVTETLYNFAYLLDGPLIEFSAFSNPSIEGIPYDPEKAEQLLDDAGYPRGSDGFRFTFEMPIYDTGADIAEIIKQMWKDVGINVNLKIVEEGAFYSLYETSEDGLGIYAASLNRMGHMTPEAVQSFAMGIRAYAHENMGFYNNSRVNDLFFEYLGTPDVELQKAAMYEIQEIMAEDMPLLYLFTTASVSAYRSKFKNVDITPLPGGRNRQKNIIYDSSLPPRETTEPDVTEPDVTEPDVTEPDITEPDWYANPPEWYATKPSWVDATPSWYEPPADVSQAPSQTPLIAGIVILVALQLVSIYLQYQKR